MVVTRYLVFLVFLLAPLVSYAQDNLHCNIPPASTPGSITVSNRADLEDACNDPPSGRVILLNPGNYTGNLTCSQPNSSSSRITIRAADPNNWPVLLANEGTDTGLWTFSGSHYTLTQVVVDRGNIHVTGNNNRISRIICKDAETGFNGDNLDSCVSLSGNNNRSDHGTLQNWTRRGLRFKPTSPSNNNRFDHWHIKDLVGASGNSGEASQFGSNSNDILNCVNGIYEYNIIDNFNNESEVISVKTQCVDFRFNTIKNISKGRISSRFGGRTNFTRNVFRNCSETRGLAILGRDNTVVSNLLDGCNITIESGNRTFQQMLDNTNGYASGGNGGCFPSAENTLVAHNETTGGDRIRIGNKGGCSNTSNCCNETVYGAVDATNTMLFNNIGFGNPVVDSNRSDTPVNLPSSTNPGNPIEVSESDVGVDGDTEDCLCQGTCPGQDGGTTPPPPTATGVASRYPEPIHSTATESNTLVIAAANCESAIESENGTGKTILINAGTCTVNTLRINNLKLYPNNGAEVTFRTTSGLIMEPGNNTTVAGFKFDASASGVDTAVTVDPSKHGTDVIRDITLRNNEFIGARGSSLVRWVGLVENGLLEGNSINGGGGPDSVGGNAVYIHGVTSLTVRNNLIYKDPSTLAFSSFGDTTGALLRVRQSCNITIEGNAFTRTVAGSNGIVQAESTTPGCQYKFYNNYWHGPTLESAHACIKAGQDGANIDLTENIFNQCGAAGGSRGAILLGEQSDIDKITASLTRNIIIAPNDSAEALAIKDTQCLKMNHNTVLDGRMEFNNPEFLGSNDCEEMRNNAFIGVRWVGPDLSSLVVNSCQSNNNNGSPESMPTGCTGTTTTGPNFEDCAFPHFRCTPRSVAFNAETGTDGKPRGASIPLLLLNDPPPEIGDGGSQVVSFKMQPDIGLTEGLNRDRITVTYNAAAQTINSLSMINNDGTVSLVNPAGSGDTVLWSTTDRWCKDQADFGHLDSSLSTHLGTEMGQVTNACIPFTNNAIVNNTSGGANSLPTAFDDTDTTPQGTAVTIDVLTNDTDPDGGTIQLITFDALSANGQSIILDDNNTSGDPTDDMLIYTPNSTFIGTDTFDYVVGDGQGGSDTGTVTVVVTAVTTTAVTYYVSDATGLDSRTDAQIQDSGTPAKTITRALAAAIADGDCAGDTVQVAGGTYRERVIVQCSGNATSSFTLRSAPGANVIVDTSSLGLSSSTASLRLDTSSEFINLQNIRVENASGSCLQIGSGNSNNLIIRNLALIGCGDNAIDLQNGGRDIVLGQIEMSLCSGASCLYANGATGLDMSNLSVHDTAGLDTSGIRLENTQNFILESSVIERTCHGILYENASNGITRHVDVIGIGGGGCTESVAYQIQSTTHDLTFLANTCTGPNCAAHIESAYDIRHIHGSYNGDIVYNPGVCGGISGSTNGLSMMLLNTMVAPTIGDAIIQYNAKYEGSWPAIYSGSNNLIDGEIQWDGNGLQDGILCPPTGITTYTGALGLAQFQTDTALWGSSIAASPFWIDPDQADYRLASVSAAIDNGACPLTSAGAVEAQTTINVNGIDPSYLFISPSQYITRTGDLARFVTTAVAPPVNEEEDGDIILSARVVSTTANTITFDVPVTLDAGDCISAITQFGTAPDIGAIEYDGETVISKRRIEGGRVEAGRH